MSILKPWWCACSGGAAGVTGSCGSAGPRLPLSLALILPAPTATLICWSLAAWSRSPGMADPPRHRVLPEQARQEAQRILDAAARRLLAEQLAQLRSGKAGGDGPRA